MSESVLLLVEQLRRRVPGGIGTAIRGLLAGLKSVAAAGSGDTVTLFASRGPLRPDPLESFGFPVLGSHLPGALMTRGWEAGLLDVPSRFDVVHATSFAMPPARHARLVVTVHDLSWRALPDAFPPRGRRWHERALRRLADSPARVVVSSEDVALQVTGAGVSRDRISLIPFGSDHLPEPDHADADKLLAGLGVDDGFLLCVGTLEPRKNLDRLFSAYSLARKRLDKDRPLVVAGPSGWGPGVEEREGVILAGPVTEAVLAALYSRAWVVAYVPLTEGYGFPPLEAMRMGTPVVSSPVPSSRGATMEIDPHDVEQISEALVAVSNDEELRSRLVEAGRVHVEDLTWEATARAHLELWRSLS